LLQQINDMHKDLDSMIQQDNQQKL